jgi:uncharacterized protein
MEQTVRGPEVADLCKRWQIRRLSVFGSIFRDDSDIDLLYEFEPGYSPGWFLVDIGDEFEALLGGRKVDMVPRKYLNHRLKDQILNSAVDLYEDKEIQTALLNKFT